MAKIKTLTINGNELDVGVPSDLSVSTATVGTLNDDGSLVVNGTAAMLRVGTTQDVGSVRINSNGSTPKIEVGKSSGDDPACTLSSDNTGNGVLYMPGCSSHIDVGVAQIHSATDGTGIMQLYGSAGMTDDNRAAIGFFGGSGGEPALQLGSTTLTEEELIDVKSGGGGGGETITAQNSGCSTIKVVLEAGSSSPYIMIEAGGCSAKNTYLGLYGCSEPLLNLGGEELAKSQLAKLKNLDGGSPTFSSITIGCTSLSEYQLERLLALI